MNTPIVDFVKRYAEKEPLRFHMPGHKGREFLGCERLDITEIPGADSLFEASGIIAQSEREAGRLFGARTFYSAEGSSLPIRTMAALVVRRSIEEGTRPLIWAGRNAHSAFLSAAALMELEVEWLYPEEQSSYLSCIVSPERLDALLRTAEHKPAALYLTSPDYLGVMADIKGLAEVCHAHGLLFLVDNAHGAYLHFLPESQHPMDLGADLCCDSAHKTLPVLTGGAYLHVSLRCTFWTDREIKETMRLFASTSPSYLILQSLDLANRYLEEGFRLELREALPRIEALKGRLREKGFSLVDGEMLKLTIEAKACGYSGGQMAAYLEEQGIFVEFCDPDYVVLMLSPLLSEELEHLGDVLCALEPGKIEEEEPPVFHRPEKVLSLRAAALAPFAELPTEQCLGRILAQPSVSCPPAVAILVGGERIDREALQCFRYYGIERCCVIDQPGHQV